ncbi:MAG TPA: hypothetical protein VJZ03_03465 [Candidatus Bathyarchaeia archaeon]|nr:hypothetical protein [Candidatus Bathyarchaeia archaeon]
MTKCELCGKDVTDKVGVFTEWKRKTNTKGFVKIKDTTLGNYDLSRDKRKAHVYCHKCKKRINLQLCYSMSDARVSWFKYSYCDWNFCGS